MNDIAPSTISSRLITTASTGRLIERSESFIALPAYCEGGLAAAGAAAPSVTVLPGCTLPVPSTTMRSPALMPDASMTLPGTRPPT